MNLATFPESVAWLNQFDDEDRETATLLLNRLRCISPTVFHSEVRGLFEAAAKSLETPIALYAAREMKTGQAYFSNRRNRPVIVDVSKEVGSEGNSAYLATTLARQQSAVFLNHPPIATLRKKKCRNVVVFDDVCGSGKRVADFISAILLNPTLTSWLSGGFIRFHVLAYAISGKAEDRILASFGTKNATRYVTFHYCQKLATDAEVWSADELRSISALCKEYGQLHKVRPFYWLGFGQCMSTLVFHHSCPNTVPGLLWERTKSWNPLFPKRSIPASLLPAFTDEPSEYQQSAILQGLDARIISRSRLFLEGTQRERELLLVLAAIRAKCESRDRISSRAGLSLSRTEVAIEECQRFGLIDISLRLTQGGYDGLNLAEERARIQTVRKTQPTIYFPTSLRSRGGQ